LIPQLPQTALNPALTLGEHVRLFWRTHSERPWGEGLARMQGLLAGCNLPGDAAFLGRYPREISVGQAQRFVIALAVLHAPDLVIGDELTSSLDNYSRSQVLGTVRHVQRESGLALLFLSHDLAVMKAFCDEIAVLHEGRIVERQEPAGMFAAPRHPFTRRLVSLTEQPLGSSEVLE
jgi:ABC-type dipeptide/oligopeptide/nickel transport system ATPase component